MTLRLRLFLVIAALVALLVVGQWLLVRSLTEGLGEEVAEVAVAVGRSVATVVGGDAVAVQGDGTMATGVVSGTDDEAALEMITEEGEDGFHVSWRSQSEPTAVAIGEVEDEGAAGGWAEDERVVERRRVVVAEGDPTGAEGRLAEGELAEGRLAEGGPTVARTRVTVRLDRASGIGERVLEVGSGEVARVVPIPERGIDRRVAGFSRRMLLGSLGLLAVGLMMAAVVAHRVSRPLAGLGDAARRVGAGELGVQAPVPGDREVGAAVVAFNSMSLRLAELDRETRALEARQQLAELGDVARGLAHSLRNPLNALGLSVEELAATAGDGDGDGDSGGDDDGDDAAGGGERAELAQAARRQIERIDRAVRSFLVLAAEGAGEAERVDLAELARDVVLEALQSGRGRVAIELVEGGDTTVPAHTVPAPTVIGVSAELRAVLQALVINAVEASPDGGRVEVRLVPIAGAAGDASDGGAGRLAVEVADRGPGLAPEVRRRLFTPHLSTKASGSGMGLYLSHRIAVDRYGGSLELTDRPGGGTVARLELGDRVGAGAGPEGGEGDDG